ncbi:unnamed protein product [Cyclocybe aegerita]|uniref:Uncharacterized protein n=1 Tax=Cyclocybe aegerita TaxID=1973307 RepID=A0A8S0X112_CYCAE|nr:unnamed protein product [Cyclocybe aegerita]
MKLSQYIAYFTVPLPQPRTVTVSDYLGSELPWLYPQSQTDSRPLDVNIWANWVRINAYLLIEDVEKWEVVRVEWWKASQGVQHEYLVLHIRHSEGSQTRWLRLERRPQEKRELRKRFVVGNSNRHITFKQCRLLRTALRQEVDMLTRRQAREEEQGLFNEAFAVRGCDTVTETVSEMGQLVGDEHQQPARLVAAYSNFGRRLTLPEAARCAALTSKSGHNDAVSLGQCYWYCRTIAGILVANYRPDVKVQGEAFGDSGKFVWANAKWGSLTLNADGSSGFAR